jgi:hypothetical protein
VMPKPFDPLTIIGFLVQSHMPLTFACYNIIRRSYGNPAGVFPSHYSSLFVLGPVRSPVFGQGLKPLPGDSLRVGSLRRLPDNHVD